MLPRVVPSWPFGRPTRFVTTLGGALALATLIGPSPAHAGNGSKKRTPVLWPQDAACLTVVDRRDTSVLHFDYGVPADDVVPPEVTDEVEDSRTHQFFAMCRQAEPGEAPPRWISAADVAAAEAQDLVPDGDGGPENILETNAQWSTCFTRITADDARVPITQVQATEGFDWDTALAPAGNYIVYGYTWEPWVNLWTGRPGIVQVHDGDPSVLPPAVSIVAPTDIEVIFRDTQLEIEGCASAMEGSTWRVDVRVIPNGGGGSWEPYLEAVPLEDEAIQFTFEPPPETWGEVVVYLRVVVEDPMGRSAEAYNWASFNVQDTVDPTGCEESGGGFIVDPGCEGGATDTDDPDEGSGEVDTAASGEDDGGVSSGPSQSEGPASACACSTGPTSGPGSGRSGRSALAWLLLCAAGLRRQRRRRGPA